MVILGYHDPLSEAKDTDLLLCKNKTKPIFPSLPKQQLSDPLILSVCNPQ